MSSGRFIFDLGGHQIDIEAMSDHDMSIIKKNAKKFITSGYAKDPARAYILAFVIWMTYQTELSMLNKDLDPIN